MTKKLYCYVDETGQDTEGIIFIVTVVIAKDKDEMLVYLEAVEKDSGKEQFKWGKADPRKRKRYLAAILTQEKYPLTIYYSIYKGSKTYKQATILSIAKAITSVRNHDESNALIRLADSICGYLRDGIETNNLKTDMLYQNAVTHGVLIRI